VITADDGEESLEEFQELVSDVCSAEGYERESL
jgi:hypothetical protein